MEAVHSYQLLDSVSDPHLDELTQLAAFICGTSVALVAIAATERHYFKSRFGLDLTESPASISFCQYAMRSNEVFEVSDTQQDPDFQHSPLVVNSPYVRFYAGVPLLTPAGLPLGTLCALDTVPHQLSHEQREALAILSRQVAAYLELGRVRKQLTDEKEKIDNILRLANSAAPSAMVGGGRSEIFVKQAQQLVRVLTADIYYVEALGDHVNVFTTQEQFTVYSTMREMEAILSTHDFARVHRKYLVRLDYILTVENDQLVLDSPPSSTQLAQAVPIGLSYKAALLARLNQV
jgi:GAF domain-containing protein